MNLLDVFVRITRLLIQPPITNSNGFFSKPLSPEVRPKSHYGQTYMPSLHKGPRPGDNTHTWTHTCFLHLYVVDISLVQDEIISILQADVLRRAAPAVITKVRARQIYDSRGALTIEVDVQTRKGSFRAAVPSGNGTGG